jgi:hypothetical protein
MLSGDEKRRDLLQSLTKGYRQGRWPSIADLRSLMEICCDPRGAIRETALTLLLSPPLAHTSHHLSWLLEQFPRLLAARQPMPPELLEQMLEVAGFAESVPVALDASGLWSKFLWRLPPGVCSWLFGRPLAVRPFIQGRWVPAMARRFRTGRHKGLELRRWRSIRHRLLATEAGAGWARLTTRDLGVLVWGEVNPGRSQVGRGCYRQIARFLTAVPASSEPGPHAPGRIQYWDGAGPQTLGYLEALIRQQSEELRRVRDLAQRLSAQTGRVVLSCHNATLAAMSGWGPAMIAEQFGAGVGWQSFEQGVFRTEREISRICAEPCRDAQRLWELYDARLIHPKIQLAVWESQRRTLLATPAAAPGSEQDLRLLRQLLGTRCLKDRQSGEGYGWIGAVSPHQRLHLSEIVRWREARRTAWKPGLWLLAAVLLEGQRRLTSGELRHLVVPWIDKFFISSRRDQDLEFFPLVLQCLAHQGCQPLVLLWEDTSHVQVPSLQLALRHWRDSGCPGEGIGVFGEGPHSQAREGAEEFILAHHRERRFFALRPYSDVYQPRSLAGLLQRRDYGFLSAAGYDSAWKDNLVFIYAGTQVAPLVSVQSDAEPFAAWLVVDGRKIPFGTFLRSRLRRTVWEHGDERLDREGLARTYAQWANLL